MFSIPVFIWVIVTKGIASTLHIFTQLAVFAVEKKSTGYDTVMAGF